MRLDLLWSGGTTPLDLADGTVTVGGGPRDDIQLQGLPHGLLTLTLLGEHVSVLAQRSVRIGQALFPARRARLLVAGEDLKLPNDVVLRRVPSEGAEAGRATVGTAFVADGLLGEAQAPPSRGATLTCVAGADLGRVYALPFKAQVLGRSPEADVQVMDRAVSRRHARLSHRGGGVVVTPVPDAMNGVFVNGQLVRRERALVTGDVLELGQTMLRYEAAAPPPEPPLRVEPITPPVVAEPAPVLVPVPAARPRELAVTTAVMQGGVALALVGAAAALAMLRGS